MATIIVEINKTTKRDWAPELHHTVEDTRALYFAQSSGWRNGNGPTFTDVGPNSCLSEAPAGTAPKYSGW